MTRVALRLTATFTPRSPPGTGLRGERATRCERRTPCGNTKSTCRDASSCFALSLPTCPSVTPRDKHATTASFYVDVSFVASSDVLVSFAVIIGLNANYIPARVRSVVSFHRPFPLSRARARESLSKDEQRSIFDAHSVPPLSLSLSFALPPFFYIKIFQCFPLEMAKTDARLFSYA